MIEIQHVKKHFGNLKVLKDVSIRVETGEVVVIIGPSGSGKTTLLRSINFLDRADAGKLTVGDLTVDLAKASRGDVLKIRRKTAMVFQNYGLFANKTAVQNIMEGLLVRKVARKEAEARALNMLEWVGLPNKRDCYPAQLSGGQQQRIGIGRALVLDPEVILLDEPTSALDPELVGEVLSLIEAVAERGVTMLIVTHDIYFAQDTANKVVFMENGAVVEEGAPGEIFLNPQHERTRKFLDRIVPKDDYII